MQISCNVKCILLECSHPPAILNGVYLGQPPFLTDHKVIYVCNGNLKLIGKRKNMCKSTGNWKLTNNKLPLCKPGTILTDLIIERSQVLFPLWIRITEFLEETL